MELGGIVLSGSGSDLWWLWFLLFLVRFPTSQNLRSEYHTCLFPTQQLAPILVRYPRGYGFGKKPFCDSIDLPVKTSCHVGALPVRRTLPSFGQLINLIHFVFVRSNKFLLSPYLAFLIIRKCDSIILPLNKGERRNFIIRRRIRL